MIDSHEANKKEPLSISLVYLSNALFSYIKALLLIPIIICKFFQSLDAMLSKPFCHSISTNCNLSSETGNSNKYFFAFSDNFFLGLIFLFLISDIISL